MFVLRFKRFPTFIALAGLLLLLTVIPSAAGLNDLFAKKELDETERQETIERIDGIQQKLKLLQDKLRALERRKAAKAAAEKVAGSFAADPVHINWQPVDETTTDPGDFGLYTYLLFKGELSDSSAVGTLEDFILTIETLQKNDIPAGLANQFLIPVEKPQSMINLGRQPYDFKLNSTYIQRLQLQDNLPSGPILVSMREPIDPYGMDGIPAFLAVSLGHQSPQRALELAQIWHQQEKDAVISKGHPISDLFWELIDGAGPTQVTSQQQRLMVELSQP